MLAAVQTTIRYKESVKKITDYRGKKLEDLCLKSMHAIFPGCYLERLRKC